MSKVTIISGDTKQIEKYLCNLKYEEISVNGELPDQKIKY